MENENCKMEANSFCILHFSFLIFHCLKAASRKPTLLGTRNADLRFLGSALDQLGGFADALAEVVQLGSASLAVADDVQLGDLRRVDRKDALDALAADDAADGEHLAGAGSAASEDDPRENLDALFGAFQNSAVDIDGIADFKLQWVRSQVFVFDLLDELVNHDSGLP